MADIDDLRQGVLDNLLHGFLNAVDGLGNAETNEEKAFHVGMATAYQILSDLAASPGCVNLLIAYGRERPEPVDIHSDEYQAANLAYNRAYRRMKVHSDPSYADEFDEDNRPYDV